MVWMIQMLEVFAVTATIVAAAADDLVMSSANSAE